MTDETEGQYVYAFNDVIHGLESHADAAESYRIRMIAPVQSQLEAEIVKRSLLASNYAKTARIIDIISTVPAGISMGLGVASISVLATVVLSPAAMATQCCSVAIGALYIIGSKIDKKLSLKADKHERFACLQTVSLIQ
jgi:hypothetical protein